MFDNPLPKFPPFTQVFPNSTFVAPTVDIILGGIEGGFAVADIRASVGGFFAGPGFWGTPILIGGASIEAAVDGLSRIESALERFKRTQQERKMELEPCH